MVNPEHPDLGPDAPSGPVPVENQPGHHPEAEQDKPDLDKFAAKLGIAGAPESNGAGEPEAAPAGRGIPTAAVAGGLAAVLAAVVAVLVGRRRRASRTG